MARAKASINFDRLVKVLKSGEEKHSEVAKKLGVQPSELDMMTFHRARVSAGIVKKAPATEASVRRLRDNEQCRWEEIAARIGTGVAAAKTLYEEGGGDSSNSYTGRGRNFSNGETPKRSTTKRGSAKRSSAKSSAAKRGSSKKRSAKRSGTSQGVTRARTRKQRAARQSSNPS